MTEEIIQRTKKIRKGDRVMALAGNEKGRVGTVLSIVGERAVVQGLNIRKKHVKPSNTNPKGGVLSLEKPIHMSNLRVCDSHDTPIKLKVKAAANGERQYVYKKDGEWVEHRSVKNKST